jgi:hypothetical protein
MSMRLFLFLPRPVSEIYLIFFHTRFTETSKGKFN